jgi:outer membrane protein assembly factor BamD (BamD/ComL family)
MFIEAATARRAGDAQSAIAKLELLLARYPRGPLAEDAAAQCMKLLRDVDHARAVRAARSYLAQHPTGFARPEAEAILGAGG